MQPNPLEIQKSHFSLGTEQKGAAAQSTRSGHVCDVGGPHRLLIVWRRSNGHLAFSKFLYRLDGEIGSSGITGAPIEVPEHAGFNGYAIPNPALELKKETLLADIGYYIAEPDGKGGYYHPYNKRLRVFGRLVANPEAVVGSGSD